MCDVKLVDGEPNMHIVIIDSISFDDLSLSLSFSGAGSGVFSAVIDVTSIASYKFN